MALFMSVVIKIIVFLNQSHKKLIIIINYNAYIVFIKVLILKSNNTFLLKIFFFRINNIVLLSAYQFNEVYISLIK